MLRYLLAALLLIALPASAESIARRIIGIANGDTCSCLTAKRDQVRVRLAGIDAPELNKPYSSHARQALSDLVFGKDITLIAQSATLLGGDRGARNSC